VLASASSVMSVPWRRSNDDITQLPELTSGRACESTESFSLLGSTHRPFGASPLSRAGGAPWPRSQRAWSRIAALLVRQSINRPATMLRRRRERFADSCPPVATRYGLVTIDLGIMTGRCRISVDNNSGCITVVHRALDGADEYAMAPVLMLLEPHRALRPANSWGPSCAFRETSNPPEACTGGGLLGSSDGSVEGANGPLD
jgi:hypothetical protein